MLPVDFDNANLTITRPVGWEEDDIDTLRLFRGAHITNGLQLTVAHFLPNKEDLDNMVKNGTGIYALIYSHVPVPVDLTTINPFPEAADPERRFFWAIGLTPNNIKTEYVITAVVGEAGKITGLISDYYFTRDDIEYLNFLLNNIPQPSLNDLDDEKRYEVAQAHRFKIIKMLNDKNETNTP